MSDRTAPLRRLVGHAIHGAILAMVALTVLTYGAILFDIALSGIGGLDLDYLTTAPQMSGRAGGVLPILVSTLVVLAVAVLAALPVSLCAALFVTEILLPNSAWARMFRASLLVLACVPSIAFGFFGAEVFGRGLGFGVSLLTGGLTLATMIVPICAFALVETFRLLPCGYRYGALALGASRSRFIFQVLLPLSLPQILSILMLGMGRALAETAALLFTSGYSDRMPQSLLDPGRVLSVHIYDLAMNIPGGDRSAATAALLLVGMFLIVSAGVLLISSRMQSSRGALHA
jgi:phosphate transport system permease protein